MKSLECRHLKTSCYWCQMFCSLLRVQNCYYILHCTNMHNVKNIIHCVYLIIIGFQLARLLHVYLVNRLKIKNYLSYEFTFSLVDTIILIVIFAISTVLQFIYFSLIFALILEILRAIANGYIRS